MAAQKEREIADKYDKSETDKSHENCDTKRNKSHRRCNYTILQWGAIAIIGILAVTAVGMSGYSLYQESMTLKAQPNHGPLTNEDWITIHIIIAAEVKRGIQEDLSPSLNEFKNTLESFSNQLADLEVRQNVEIRSLHAELRDLRDSSERNQTKSDFTILQLSKQSNKSREQIEQLYGTMSDTKTELSELFEQQNLTQENITRLRDVDILTRELLADKTSELRDYLLSELDKTQQSWSATEDGLVRRIDGLNGTLQTVSDEFQESIANLSHLLEIHNTQNDLNLEAVNTNLTERILATQEHIKLLSYTLNSMNTDLQEELRQLGFATQDNFTRVENSIALLNDTGVNSIQQVKIELLQRVNITELELVALRVNSTTKFGTLSTLIRGVNDDLSERISANNGLITDLTAEARLSHTQLTATITSNNEMQTTSFRGLQSVLDQDINQVTTSLEHLQGKATSNQQRVTGLEQDIENIKTHTSRLESRQWSTSSDVRALSDKVGDYHSDATSTLSSATLVSLATIIALAVVKLNQ